MSRSSRDERDVARLLRGAGCVAADREAAELCAAAPDVPTLDAWVHRREQGEPLAWITGSVTFCGRQLRVDRGVYVPRPQTEGLARRAAAALPTGGRAVDLCSGSGAVAAHLRAGDLLAAVVGVELDPVAARCTWANGVPVVLGDLDAPLHAPGIVDVVTAVAPYVPHDALALLPRDIIDHEPLLALDGGDVGLDVLRRVVAATGRLLRPGGRIFVELGGGQDRLLAPDLAAAGLVDVEPWADEEGDLRGLSAARA